MRTGVAAALLLAGAFRASAQTSPPAPQAAPAPIQDNSFFVEEAYNQEVNVVQTIQTFERTRGSGDWFFTLTQEWPASSQRHQLSATIPFAYVAGSPGGRGLGDVALNYRYQLVGDGNAKVAISPRLTLLLPTGDEARGLGTGSWGPQIALPLSVVLGPRLVSHSNVGLTILPRAATDTGGHTPTLVSSLGQSLVWLAHPNVNLLAETVYTHTSSRDAGGPSGSEWIFSPGVRAAINVGKLQIVPGLAFPIGLGPSRGERSVFLYLSFEHPFGPTE